jgi:hypothetical protein
MLDMRFEINFNRRYREFSVAKDNIKMS